MSKQKTTGQVIGFDTSGQPIYAFPALELSAWPPRELSLHHQVIGKDAYGSPIYHTPVFEVSAADLRWGEHTTWPDKVTFRSVTYSKGLIISHVAKKDTYSDYAPSYPYEGEKHFLRVREVAGSQIKASSKTSAALKTSTPKKPIAKEKIAPNTGRKKKSSVAKKKK